MFKLLYICSFYACIKKLTFSNFLCFAYVISIKKDKKHPKAMFECTLNPRLCRLFDFLVAFIAYFITKTHFINCSLHLYIIFLCNIYLKRKFDIILCVRKWRSQCTFDLRHFSIFGRFMQLREAY